jgi:flagellar motor switch protein FliM
MITRHPDKLFEVIEFVLNNDRTVVTHNYLIKNGHVAQRMSLLRPAHTVREARDKFQDRSGLSDAHDQAIREIASYL